MLITISGFLKFGWSSEICEAHGFWISDNCGTLQVESEAKALKIPEVR